MKNKILSLFSNSIPYIKELRPVAGSVTAAIVMQQLDYWFARKPQGFYKYLEPPKGKASFYREGDSWCEEIGLSAEEFKTAFDKIGVAHKSKTEFKQALDKGEVFLIDGVEKFYARYHDRGTGTSFYYRNDVLVDHILDDLITPLETDNDGLRETENVGLHVRTEITVPETNLTKNTTLIAAAEVSSGSQALSTQVLSREIVPLSKGDVTSAILELVKKVRVADSLEVTLAVKLPKDDPTWTNRDGEYFKIFAEAFDILSSKSINWRMEGKHCKTLVKDIKEGRYTAENVIYCVAWAYHVGKFDFYSISALSVPKLMPSFLDLYRRGELQESLKLKPKFETAGQRTERIYAEQDRNREQDISKAAALAAELARQQGVTKRAKI